MRECATYIAPFVAMLPLRLLTTTATAFFRRIGSVAVDRAEAPPALHGSEEFAHVCPASAVCMLLRL